MVQGCVQPSVRGAVVGHSSNVCELLRTSAPWCWPCLSDACNLSHAFEWRGVRQPRCRTSLFRLGMSLLKGMTGPDDAVRSGCVAARRLGSPRLRISSEPSELGQGVASKPFVSAQASFIDRGQHGAPSCQRAWIWRGWPCRDDDHTCFAAAAAALWCCASSPANIDPRGRRSLTPSRPWRCALRLRRIGRGRRRGRRG